MKKLLAVLLALAMIFAMTACGEKTENGEDNSTESRQSDASNGAETSTANQEEDNDDEETVATSIAMVQFFGKVVKIPCSLADLEAMDIHLWSEDEREQILSTPNGLSYMCNLVYGDNDIPMEAFFVHDEAGNITLEAVNNTGIGKDYFEYSGFGCGDSIDDVIVILGKADSCIITNGGDDIHSGPVRLVYVNGNESVRISFRDGVLTQFEVSVD